MTTVLSVPKKRTHLKGLIYLIPLLDNVER